jgi:HEAT repeat protein
MKQLEDPDVEIRSEALKKLTYDYQMTNELDYEIKKMMVPILIRLLNDENANIRARSVTALGYIGLTAAPAIPAMIEMLRNDDNRDVQRACAEAFGNIGSIALPAILRLFEDDKNKLVRILAAHAMGRMTSGVEAAVPALIEALKNDTDKDIRKMCAQTLGDIGPVNEKVILTLLETLKTDDDKEVRSEAALSLSRRFSENDRTVQALIEALRKDNDKDVRSTSAIALSFIGHRAAPAVTALIEALSHDEDDGVRYQSARTFGYIGASAKASIPVLTSTLKDSVRNSLHMRRNAAESLAKIATALHDEKDLKSLGNLKIAKNVIFSDPELADTEEAKAVKRAVEYLETLEPPLWEQIREWVFRNILKSSLILAYVLWVIVCIIIYWLRPIALLRINHTLKTDVKLSAKLGSITLPLNYLLFAGLLNYRTRVLDAYVKKHIPSSRKNFEQKTTVNDRRIHISVPVELNGKTVADLKPKSLRPSFARHISCLLIWGEGGSGKTSLACQIAKWAMSEDKESRICEHLMLPALIEQELNYEGDEAAFLNAVGRQLQHLTDQANPIPEELLDRLLRQRRILVVVDHLSEMSEETRKQIDPQQHKFPANAFIATSRLEETLGGINKTIIKPLRIRRDRLSPFMEAYLTHRGKSDLFTDSEFHDACRRLTEMVGERDLTLLLAKLYAEQLIIAKEAIADDKLPDNIPDLMLSYLNEINRNVAEENMPTNLTIHNWAKALAWQSLKEKFHPSPVRIDNALAALSDEITKDPLGYLENRLRLIKTEQPMEDRFTFLLDPLAEYLAALHLLDLYGDNKAYWNNFLAEADQKQGAPETIKGFLLAVRDCIIAKGKEHNIPNFVEEELGKRTGLDPEALERATQKRRIQRLTNQLGFAEAIDRHQAAQALGKLRSGAKEAVPELVLALKDEDDDVRRTAAWALGEIGPEARDALPDLIEAFNDKNEGVRRYAAVALGQIGPVAILNLVETLKNKNPYVRLEAARALGHIRPAAKEAVPALTQALNDEDRYVRRYVRRALKQIDPTIEIAVLDLNNASEDKDFKPDT